MVYTYILLKNPINHGNEANTLQKPQEVNRNIIQQLEEMTSTSSSKKLATIMRCPNRCLFKIFDHYRYTLQTKSLNTHEVFDRFEIQMLKL